MLSDEVLRHVGIMGMKWGVRRNRNRPGGADGTEESKKVVDKRGKLTKNLDSMKRERQWKSVLNDMDKLSTKDIAVVTSRVKLENNLKNLSKSAVGKPKDKADYLQRQNMSNEELKRKVTRLQTKEQLYKSVRDASKEQREFGQKVVNIGKTLSINYALKKSISPKDIFDIVTKPADHSKTEAGKAQADLQKTILEKIQSRKSN